ncbi:dnaJ homolog subfamily B member 9-like isoform X2 [Pungitius pungitius]
MSPLCNISSTRPHTIQGMTAQRVSHLVQAYVALVLCFSEVLHAASESSRSYYDVLNVEPSATDSHIKKAFRRLAIKCHPDKDKSADAEKSFREIVEAYTVLSTKEKRKRYDSVGHEAFLKDEEASDDPEDEHDTSFPFGVEDLFHDFDGSPFAEETFFRRTFYHNGADMDGPYEHSIMEESDYSFILGDEEEEHYFY